MEGRVVPKVLAGRLGPAASDELLGLLDAAEDRCMNLSAECAVERFERRLTEEVSGLRLEMIQGHAALRQEMTDLGGQLRRGISDLGGRLRHEMADQKADLLKWSFLLWIGQVVTLTAIMALLLRS